MTADKHEATRKYFATSHVWKCDLMLCNASVKVNSRIHEIPSIHAVTNTQEIIIENIAWDSYTRSGIFSLSHVKSSKQSSKVNKSHDKHFVKAFLAISGTYLPFAGFTLQMFSLQASAFTHSVHHILVVQGAFFTILGFKCTDKNYIRCRRVSKYFDWGANNNQNPTFKNLMPLIFKVSLIKRTITWRFFPEQLFSDLSRQIKSLFSLNWQGLNFDFGEIPNFNFGWKPPFLVKLSCKSACENLNVISRAVEPDPGSGAGHFAWSRNRSCSSNLKSEGAGAQFKI